MGEMEIDYCNLLINGIWLEFNFMTDVSAMISTYLFAFSDDMTIPLGGQKSKDIAKSIFRHKNFQNKGALSNRYQSFGYTLCLEIYSNTCKEIWSN
jgi:hypothetical protein